MIVYAATSDPLPVGQQLPLIQGESTGHQSRTANNDEWSQMEQIIDDLRLPNEHSRKTCYFACESLEECSYYKQLQIIDPFTGAPVGPQQIHYYRLEMPNPTKAVMALIARGMHHLHEPAVLEELGAEYWRQPQGKWQYFEFLDPHVEVLEEVEPPDDLSVFGAAAAYSSDITMAKNRWPEE
jgi:hypothetical protein